MFKTIEPKKVFEEANQMISISVCLKGTNEPLESFILKIKGSNRKEAYRRLNEKAQNHLISLVAITQGVDSDRLYIWF